MLRRIKTSHSQWIIDEELQRFIRIPLEENPDHPSLKYFGTWEDYDLLEELESDGWHTLIVTRSSDGHRLVTHYRPEIQVSAPSSAGLQ